MEHAAGGFSSAPETGADRNSQDFNVSSTPTDQTTQVMSKATDGTKLVAATAQQGAQDVMGAAREQAAELADEMKTQTRQLLDESKTHFRSQAQIQTDQLASVLRTVSEQVKALAEGRPEDAGAVGDYAREVSHSVSRVASRMDERGFDGVLHDVQRFARRRPGTFLLAAAVAGFGVTRLVKQANSSSEGTQHVPAQTFDAPDTAFGSLGMPQNDAPRDPGPVTHTGAVDMDTHRAVTPGIPR